MGLLAALIATVMAPGKDIFSKYLAGKMSGTVSAFTSFVFALPFYVVVLTILSLVGLEDWAFSRTFFLYVVLRALSDTGAEWCKMQALGYGDISVVLSIIALSPVSLILLSPMITGDPITSWGAAGLIVGVVGTLIVTRAGMRAATTDQAVHAQRTGCVYALLSAVCFGVNICFDRLAVQQASATLSAAAMTVLSAAFLLPLLLRHPRAVSQMKESAGPLLGRGFFEVASMVARLIALQSLTAPYVVGIQRLSLIISVAAGGSLFREERIGERLVGACAIVVGVLMIVAGE